MGFRDKETSPKEMVDGINIDRREGPYLMDKPLSPRELVEDLYEVDDIVHSAGFLIGYEDWDSDDVEHSGVGHLGMTKDGRPGRSGRYLWGSGEEPNQHGADGATDFIDRYKSLRGEGLKDEEIREALGYSSVDELKNVLKEAREYRARYRYSEANRLRNESVMNGGGANVLDIASELGISDKEAKGLFKKYDNNYTNNGQDFIDKVESLTASGKSATEIASILGYSTGDYRNILSICKEIRSQYRFSEIERMKSEGITNQSEMARQLGVNESIVRGLIKKYGQEGGPVPRAEQVAAGIIKDEVDKKGFVDIGAGTELELGISQTKLSLATELLRKDGYEIYGLGVPQMTNGKQQTNIQVACKPGTTYQEVYTARNEGLIFPLKDYYHSEDGGETFNKLQPPVSIDSSRILIRYADDLAPDGHPSVERDGTIELRRNVPDLSLGGQSYSQVRIGVDGTHYLKGIAVYADDIPDGYDVVVNSNKPAGTDKYKVFKEMQPDPDNRFGALIKANGQSYYTDPVTGEKKLSAINKIREEGDWNEWSHDVPTQLLAKQDISLINRQIAITKDQKLALFNEYKSINNPTIKKYYMNKFAEECESDAVDMQLAGFPRQRYQLLMPIPTLKDDEFYAPNYRNGERVALIRFPHGGKFEIAIGTVNNNNKDAQNKFKNDKGLAPQDIIGINSNVAGRLSGADFDGDTAMVIPLSKAVDIRNAPELPGLKGYEPKVLYSTENKRWIDPETGEEKCSVRLMKKSEIQKQMGGITNLIMDMTVKGAAIERDPAHPDELTDLEKAVRHSMVIIDAYKHKLDWQQSEKDNDIKALKLKYQGVYNEETGRTNTPASTLFTQAKSPTNIPERQGSGWIDEEGNRVYKESGKMHRDKKTGQMVLNTITVDKLSAYKDARELSSGTIQEEAYAGYSNFMKDLARQARLEFKNTGNLLFSRQAAMTYDTEVKSLVAKLNEALMNAPRERRALIIANSRAEAKIAADPSMDKKQKGKIRQIELNKARIEAGSNRAKVKISDKEWEAIQAGAVTDTFLNKILNNSDPDILRERAMPKVESRQMTSSQESRMKSLARNGYSNAEIADELGVSVSTVQKYVKGVREGS